MLAERFVCGLRGPIICGEVAALPLQIAVKLRTQIALPLCEKPCPVALRTVDPFETLLPAGFDVKLPENHVEGAPAGTRLGRPPASSFALFSRKSDAVPLELRCSTLPAFLRVQSEENALRRESPDARRRPA